jgi:hypothetical protein
MKDLNALISEFDSHPNKAVALDRLGVECDDERSAELYLFVSTSDQYDIETRQYAARLLRYAFPESIELQSQVVTAALSFASDKAVDEDLRRDFLEVIAYSDRSFETIKGLVRMMADSDDSPDVREAVFDALVYHLDKQMIQKAIDEIRTRDAMFIGSSARLLQG